jgi:hypothetical protein
MTVPRINAKTGPAGMSVDEQSSPPPTPVRAQLLATEHWSLLVNAIVAGTLGALIGDAAAGDPLTTSLAGIVAGVTYLTLIFEAARRSFAQPPLVARFPTPDQGPTHLTGSRTCSSPGHARDGALSKTPSTGWQGWP